MDSVELVRKICKEKKIPISKLERDLGYSNGYIGQLRKGVFPTNRLVEIAQYLSVSVDYLLGTETEKAPTQEGERQPDINQAKIALFGGDGEVTDEMWEEAIFAAQLIKERHKRKKGN